MLEIIVTGVVGIISGNIMMFLLFPQKRKSENLKNEAQDIENEVKQSEEWRKLYNKSQEENKELNIKIDSLYGTIATHRDENTQLRIENTKLMVENTKLELLKCNKPSCPHRQPPTGY